MNEKQQPCTRIAILYHTITSSPHAFSGDLFVYLSKKTKRLLEKMTRLHKQVYAKSMRGYFDRSTKTQQVDIPLPIV